MSPTNTTLLNSAIEAVITLDRQLNVLLDAYDFFVDRYSVDGATASTRLELADAQVSIKELGQLPHQIALQLAAWKNELTPEVSHIGFELYTLNEFALHMMALTRFMHRKDIDISQNNPLHFRDAINTLKKANEHLGRVSA
jgi:hypothetical protein